ncbi:MAG TPA: hypothetical protein VGF26_25430 [Ramlibacter sp.]
MKISLSILHEPGHDESAGAQALRSWYAARPAVRRLWAIRPEEPIDSAALRVILMLEPSPDGDDHSPRWMAHGSRWASELSEQLASPVQLERIDGPLPEEFEIDGEGVLVSALGWRDCTTLPRD